MIQTGLCSPRNRLIGNTPNNIDSCYFQRSKKKNYKSQRRASFCWKLNTQESESSNGGLAKIVYYATHVEIWSKVKSSHTHFEPESVKRSARRCSCRDRAWPMSQTPTPQSGSFLSCWRRSRCVGIGCCRWRFPLGCGTDASAPCHQTSECIWEKINTFFLKSHFSSKMKPLIKYRPTERT